jgi:hypothetical protein
MRAPATFLLIASLSGQAWAQEPQPPATTAAAPAAEAPTTIDATKLGVSLARIQKGLRLQPQATSTSPGAPIRLQFQVQVYGQAPRIDVLKGVDLFNGQVPGSAPSHGQMIDFWTPPAYSAPALPFSTLAFWAAQQLWKKGKKSACEEEIANYRALVMQGVNVSAPRCTQ